MRGVRATARVVACLPLVACGGEQSSTSSGMASCTMTFSDGDGAYFRQCTEASGGTRDQFEAARAACSGATAADGGLTIDGTFALGPCSRVGVVVGCELPVPGGRSTIWFYRVGDAAIAQPAAEDFCAGSQRRIVDP